jgi:hypothetical protein
MRRNPAHLRDSPDHAGRAAATRHSTPRSPIWAFVNTPFALFLFSSLFIGLLSFSYGQWVKRGEQRRTAELLDLEISLRVKDVAALAEGKNRDRYSNLRNIDRIIRGDTEKFWIRQPLSNDFEKKSLTTLLWQLYLVVPTSQQASIRSAIRTWVDINANLARIRYQIADSLPDRPRGRTTEEEDKLAEAEDVLTKDFGHAALYSQIREAARFGRWQLHDN